MKSRKEEKSLYYKAHLKINPCSCKCSIVKKLRDINVAQVHGEYLWIKIPENNSIVNNKVVVCINCRKVGEFKPTWREAIESWNKVLV